MQIFNNAEDVKKAVQILDWSYQYMDINQAHTSKIDYVKASSMILKKAGDTNPDLNDEEADLIKRTLKNCLKFYELNSPEPLDSIWVSSLTSLKDVKADWF